MEVQLRPGCRILIAGKQHPDFITHYEKAIRILSSGPYNRTAPAEVIGCRIKEG
jgi:hypothetical protein